MATALHQDGPRIADGEPELTPPGGPSRRRFVLPIIGLLVLLALVWAVKQWSYGRTHESTDNAQVDGDLVPVLAKVGGYVQRLTVDENQHVATDSMLVQIDPSEYRVRLAQAQADLAAAQAAAGGAGAAGQAEAAVTTASEQRAALDAQIAAARANAQKANADLARMKELAAKQIVSKQQLDAATAAAQAADATLVGLQRSAGAAGATVTNAQAGVRLAEARLQAAQAALDNAKLQLGYTRVVAPSAGTVSRKQVDVGQLVQPGQPLLTIVSDSGAWITANFKETQLSDMKVGEQAEVEVDAYPGCTAKAKVESIGAATGAKFALLPPDNATGNFTKVVQRVPVRLAILEGCGKDRPLRPGMSTTVHVSTK